MGLRKYFLAGILAILPLGITVWILSKVFATIDSTVGPITRWTGAEVPGTGFAATFVFVFLVAHPVEG